MTFHLSAEGMDVFVRRFTGRYHAGRRFRLRMGTAWRSSFTLPVVAVTGSNGKTTTKEMISAILAQWQGDDVASGDGWQFNNDRRAADPAAPARAASCRRFRSWGMNHPGEIERLAAMAAPTVALR